MQLFPASERLPVRLGLIVAIAAGAMAVGVLLLLALYAGTSGEQARSSAGDVASASLPVVVAPRVAPAAPQSAVPQTVAPQVAASSRTASIEPQSAPARSSGGIKPNQSTPLDPQLLFFPRRYPNGDWKPTGLQNEDAWITSVDGTKLHGWYLPCDKPQAVILYLHGNAGNITDDAVVYRFFRNHLHATALAFDYRGYGRSEGRATIDGVLADAQAARAWLANKAGVPESAVVLMGRSLGGAVAVQLAGDIKPRGLILENTFSSLRAMARNYRPQLAELVPLQSLDSGAILAHYDGPLLQAHAATDQTVPIELGEDLFRVAVGQKEFFRAAGIGHNDQLPDEYYGKVMAFVAGLK